jgi:hypothetical protein
MPSTLKQPVHAAGAPVRARRPAREPGRRPRPWRWAVPRDDLKRLLGEGLSASEIARRYGVNHTTVSRAIRALEHQDLVSVVLGNRAQPTVPDVPTPTLDAPVDVMGVVMRVIGDIEAMRLWLNSEDAKAVLTLWARYRLSHACPRRVATLFSATTMAYSVPSVIYLFCDGIYTGDVELGGNRQPALLGW